MDTTAPSLLWAAQLRREHVHLVNTMNEYKAILTAATNTIETLRNTVHMLTERVSTLQEQQGTDREESLGKIRDIEEESKRENEEGLEKFEEMTGRLCVLEDEKGKLREEMDGVSHKVKDLGSRVKELEEMNEEMVVGAGEVVEKVKGLETENGTLRSVQEKQTGWAMRTMGEAKDKRVPATSAGPKRTRTDQDGDEEMRIPDSIPTPLSRHSVRDSMSRTLSETTCGSLTDLDKSYTFRKLPSQEAKRISAGAGGGVNTKAGHTQKSTLNYIRQDDRSLLGYLRYFDAIRSRSNEPEEVFVLAWINGLQDPVVKAQVQEHRRTSGLSWHSVFSFVEGMAQVSDEAAGKDEKAAKGVSKPKQRETKGRRSILIVPPDEEDEPFMT